MRRLIAIGAVPLFIVIVLLMISALNGAWTLDTEYRENFARHISQLPAEFMPVPIAFLLWVSLMERQQPFTLSFSPFFFALSVAGPAMMHISIPGIDMRAMGMRIAVISGFFVLAPFKQCLQRALKNPRATFVALIAGLAAYNYYWLMFSLWEKMCGWTTYIVAVLLKLLAFDAVPEVSHQGRTAVAIHSPYFNILVNPGCNGLEGIFLFNFMLSVILLLDWPIFKQKSVLFLYGLGIVYMFFMNCLRIFLFFTLGYWAYNPHAWPWLQALRGGPVYLFHSYVGWIFYLIAFGIFAGLLYRKPIRN